MGKHSKGLRRRALSAPLVVIAVAGIAGCSSDKHPFMGSVPVTMTAPTPPRHIIMGVATITTTTTTPPHG